MRKWPRDGPSRFHGAPRQVMALTRSDLAPARGNTKAFPNALSRMRTCGYALSGLGVFDFIYCQEVLHHTGDARSVVRNLVEILAPGGEIAIYVYRQKSARARVHGRCRSKKISALPYDEAMVVCRQITELGRRMAEVEQEIEVDDFQRLASSADVIRRNVILYNFFPQVLLEFRISRSRRTPSLTTIGIIPATVRGTR